MAGGKKSPRTKIPAARVKEAADVAAALQREASGSKHERDGYQQGMESGVPLQRHAGRCSAAVTMS